jgi:membrane-associated phospholipid phosphatase
MLTNTKPGLVVLLLLVFAVNLAETSWETSLHTESPVSAADYKGAYAVQQFEPEFINFEFHDQTAEWAMYAYSVSYFVLFPVLAFGVLIALARRNELAPFRVLCLAVTADYIMSLPWFLLFPVPERWAYPDSNAMLLSDRWSSSLINSIRPLSGLNNSFPSTHVSLTVIVILVCWLWHVRLRSTVTALGTTVILATFVLGIHWLADIVAGVAVGALSVGVAWRWTDTSERLELALESDRPIVRKRARTARQLAEAGGFRF